MADAEKSIKEGDIVRAHSGKNKGKIGDVMMLLRYPSGGTSVLVSFIDGTAAYCSLTDLEVITSEAGGKK